MRRKVGLGAPGNEVPGRMEAEQAPPFRPRVRGGERQPVVLRADCKHLLPAPPSDFILVAWNRPQWGY